MSGRNVLGCILSLVGGLMGILLTPYFFMLQYTDLIAAEAALGGSGLGCALVVQFIFPFISDLGMIAGAMYLVAAISFMSKNDKYAFKIAVVANVLALQAAFWPIIPLLVTQMIPTFAIMFLSNLVIFFLLLLSVGRISGKTTLMALLTGMAWVLAFMNGVASTNRITVLMGSNPLWVLYTTMQRVNWVASLGWGVTTVLIILEPKELVRKLGLGSAILAIVAGYPSGMISPFGGGFSMFLLGPMLSTLLLLLFISPKLWEKLVISRKE